MKWVIHEKLITPKISFTIIQLKNVVLGRMRWKAISKPLNVIEESDLCPASYSTLHICRQTTVFWLEINKYAIHDLDNSFSVLDLR